MGPHHVLALIVGLAFAAVCLFAMFKWLLREIRDAPVMPDDEEELMEIAVAKSLNKERAA